jgi:hypothetical protein
VRFVVMAGKDARGLPQSGELTRLSAVAAELVASWQPRLLDDLRIDLCDEQGATVAEGLYAKVLAGQTETAGAFLIRFTAVPPAVETLIGRLLLKIEG